MNDTHPHVGLDAHLLSGTASYRSAGIHGYIVELLRRLPQTDATIRYTAFASQASSRLVSGMKVRATRWPTTRPLVRILWEQLALPWAASSERLALLHGLAFVTPLMCPCPAVVTVHDLSFALFPEFFRGANAAYLRIFTSISCRRAARVIAVSENTRADVMRLYRVPGEQIDAVPHGVDPAFHPRPASEVAEFRRSHSLPDRLVLFVGTLEPRKNLVKLVEAFGKLRAGTTQDVKLVLAGGKGWYYDSIFATVERLDLRGRVIFAGYVPNEELPMWYNAADVFAFPSRYEGFGMPVLEAMACGTPVVTARTSSLPEVAGDAALTVPPDDTDALAEALRRALQDAPLRQEMRTQGIARAARFTWEETARRTVVAYRRALALDR
jgi:glycosyltransferase involved in cell wall biosynthesis